MLLNYETLYLEREQNQQLWIGDFSPFKMSLVNIHKSTGYRLATQHHGKYKLVWFYEKYLSDFASWPLILDELIRLIDCDGKIVIRTSQNDSCNIIKIKNNLYRNPTIKVSIESEYFVDGVFEIVFCIDKLNNIKGSHSKQWTFSLLTTGNKVDNVIDFCRSIRALDLDNSHEILICGPKNELYDEFKVTYIKQKFSDKFADISSKKNAIARAAKYDNILIAHDRYVINADFFRGFEKFGYDFDILAISQFYESGEKFPNIAYIKNRMVWSKPTQVSSPSFFHPNMYINGGLFICKKSTLLMIPMNDLLFWNQAEDVELSQVFIERGLPIRWNVHSSATTLGITPEYTKSFLKDNLDNENKVQVHHKETHECRKSPSDNDVHYVTNLYSSILGRSPDEQGLQFYIKTLKKVNGKQRALLSIVFSSESRSRHGAIGAFYKYLNLTFTSE